MTPGTRKLNGDERRVSSFTFIRASNISTVDDKMWFHKRLSRFGVQKRKSILRFWAIDKKKSSYLRFWVWPFHRRGQRARETIAINRVIVGSDRTRKIEFSVWRNGKRARGPAPATVAAAGLINRVQSTRAESRIILRIRTWLTISTGKPSPSDFDAPGVPTER